MAMTKNSFRKILQLRDELLKIAWEIERDGGKRRRRKKKVVNKK